MAAAFHNWWHVCDVTHAATVFLCEGGARRRLPAEECLALLLAALTHDAEHPGTSNAFLARTQDPKVRARCFLRDPARHALCAFHFRGRELTS